MREVSGVNTRDVRCGLARVLPEPLLLCCVRFAMMLLLGCV